jgi:hypothetical protein
VIDLQPRTISNLNVDPSANNLVALIATFEPGLDAVLKPGAEIVTNTPADIRSLRYRIRFWDPDQRIDEIDESHFGMARIGNDACQGKNART